MNYSFKAAIKPIVRNTSFPVNYGKTSTSTEHGYFLTDEERELLRQEKEAARTRLGLNN